MAPSRFTPAVRYRIVALLAAGAGLADAAEGAGVCRDTLQRWLRRGHDQAEGDFADFSAACAAARAEAALPTASREPVTEAEFRQILDRQVRSGSVKALAFWREERQRERQQAKGTAAPGGRFDELWARRHRAVGPRNE